MPLGSLFLRLSSLIVMCLISLTGPTCFMPSPGWIWLSLPVHRPITELVFNFLTSVSTSFNWANHFNSCESGFWILTEGKYTVRDGQSHRVLTFEARAPGVECFQSTPPPAGSAHSRPIRLTMIQMTNPIDDHQSRISSSRVAPLCEWFQLIYSLKPIYR